MPTPLFTPDLIAHYAKGAVLEQAPPATPTRTDAHLMHTLGLPVFLGGQGADLATTLMALKSGRGQEANPILGDSPTRITLTKAATTAAMAWLLDHLAHQPKTKQAALIMALVGGGVGAGLAVHNARVGQ